MAKKNYRVDNDKTEQDDEDKKKETSGKAADESEEEEEEKKETSEDEDKEDTEAKDGDGTDEDEEAEDDKKDKASAERARISAILTSPEASGREKLAQKLAFKSGMSAKEAIDILSSAEKSTSGGGLDAKMAGVKNPDVGGGSANKEQNPVLAAMRKHTPGRLK